LRFGSTVEFGRIRRRSPNLTIQRGGFPLEHKPTPNTIDRVHVHPQHIADLRPGQTAVRSISITQQEHLRMPDFTNRGMAMTSEFFQTLTLIRR
jgi:hypothetical protein